MNEQGNHVLPHRGWILVYAGGNGLSIAVFLMLYQITAVLSDFRDPMLYALLCSIALRAPKDWIVERLGAQLAQNRTLLRCALSVFNWPSAAVMDIYNETTTVLRKWKQAVIELREEHMKKARRRSGSFTATSTTGQQPLSSATLPPPSAAPSTIALYYTAGIHTLRSRKDKRKRRKKSGVKSTITNGDLLLFWLLRACIAWAVFEWIKDSWSSTLQILVFTGIAILCVAAFPFAYLTTTSHWQHLASVFPHSPTKTPTTPKSPHHRAVARRRILTVQTDVGTPLTNDTTTPFSPRAINRLTSVPSALWKVYFGLDGWLRGVLRANLHALVTLMLVVGLFIGATAAGAFLSARVIQEGRAVVLAARGAFPAPWVAGPSSSSASTTSNVLEVGVTSSGAAALPSWVDAYRRDALQIAQRSLPAVGTWLESQFQGYLDTHNLTHALGDVRLLYESVQGQRQCADKERQHLLVALARAEVAVAEATRIETEKSRAVETAQKELNAALAVVDNSSQLMKQTESDNVRKPLKNDRKTSQDENSSSASDGGTLSEEGTNPEQPSESTWTAVVLADAFLSNARSELRDACTTLEAAQKARRTAAARLQLCVQPGSEDALNSSADRGLAAEVGERLQSAYTKLWRRQLHEGAFELKQAAMQAVRGITQTDGAVSATDLPALLQRLLHTAAVPLTAIGRALAGSLGSTTAAAVMGSMGLLRLGLGVVNLGVQGVLFVTLLYYLLAAERDPLTLAAAHLPLSEGGRQRAAAAVNKALGGVFMSMLKLSMLHFLLTWLAYRIMVVPLVYTSAIASAAFSLLPFIPTYAVAVPGSIVLAIQGRMASAVLLLVIQFVGYYVGDTLVLEQAGNPLVVSLSILGGLWAFSNPLLGCFLGPILVSLLSAVGTLLADLLAADKAAWATPATKEPHNGLQDVSSGMPARQLRLSTGGGLGAKTAGRVAPPAVEFVDETAGEIQEEDSEPEEIEEETSLNSFSFGAAPKVRTKLE